MTDSSAPVQDRGDKATAYLLHKRNRQQATLPRADGWGYISSAPQFPEILDTTTRAKRFMSAN